MQGTGAGSPRRGRHTEEGGGAFQTRKSFLPLLPWTDFERGDPLLEMRDDFKK